MRRASAAPPIPLDAGARERYGALLATLPLGLDSYGPKVRDDTLLALAEVAATEPNGPLAPGTPVHAGDLAESTGTLVLPEEAPFALGLTGFNATGKDELPTYLQRAYADVTRFAFSDVIIDEANAFLEPHGYHIDQRNKADDHWRHLLQAFGSGRRVEDRDYWNTPITRMVKGLVDGGARMAIVAGLRITTNPDTGEVSLHDLETVHAVDGSVWNVDRPGRDGGAAGAHHNEAALATLGPEDFDGWLVNGVEGDLGAYYENLEALLRGEPQPHIPEGYPYTAEQLQRLALRR